MLRVNVLIIAAAIVAVVAGGFVALYIGVPETPVIAVIAAGITPLSMICKELLTDPPPPNVPASLVEKMLSD